jgi:hypothetical protein
MEVIFLSVHTALLAIISAILLYIVYSFNVVRPVKRKGRRLNIPQNESTKEDLVVEDTLPIEQFTPDFTKPLKFVVKEDSDSTTLEEVQDERA